MTYKQTYFLTNADMDIDFRMSNISAIMYFQDCVAQYLTTKNLAAFDIKSKGLYWVIGSYNMEFEEDMPFWSEQIEVKVWASKISKLKIQFECEIYHKNDIVVKGNGIWLILDSETKRPTHLDFVKEVVPEEETETIAEKTLFEENGETLKEITHKISLSDLDFNMHVNNKSYLNIAKSTVSQQFSEEYYLKKSSVKYLKESFLNDDLICTVKSGTQPLEYIHIIKRGDDDICKIKSMWEKRTNHQQIENYPLTIRQNF